MRSEQPPGVALSLLLSCHPLPAAAATVALTVAAAVSGRSGPQCLLVTATVLSGQLTIGWINDVVDADRDRRAGRRDKPVARGWIDRRTVTVATACMALLTVPLSLANGTVAGCAHLGFVLSGWAYDLWLKQTVLSWLPYVVGFGLLPAFLSYGGLGGGSGAGPGGGLTSGPPTWQLTVSVALLALGIHFLNTLPDLEEDDATGVRHLPLRVAQRIGHRRLLRVSMILTVGAAGALLLSALTVGLRQ